MKKNAGTLKLSLAQYRELEAFSQFASDLDADTKNQLERGKRMVEILKQGIFAPVPFEKQVALIFAGSAGYLDRIDTHDILQYERDLYVALDREEKILTTIRDSKDFSDETKAALGKFIENFGELFTKKK